MCYFLVPWYVLLSCPVLCVTFLSLCYVLLSCPFVMCYFLVICYVLLAAHLIAMVPPLVTK